MDGQANPKARYVPPGKKGLAPPPPKKTPTSKQELAEVWKTSRNASERHFAGLRHLDDANISGHGVIGSDEDVLAYVNEHAKDTLNYLTAWLWNNVVEWSPEANARWLKEVMDQNRPVAIASKWANDALVKDPHAYENAPKTGSTNKEIHLLYKAGYRYRNATMWPPNVVLGWSK